MCTSLINLIYQSWNLEVSRWLCCKVYSSCIPFTARFPIHGSSRLSGYNSLYDDISWHWYAWMTCNEPWQEKMTKDVHMLFTRYDCFSTIMLQPLWQLKVKYTRSDPYMDSGNTGPTHWLAFGNRYKVLRVIKEKDIPAYWYIPFKVVYV